MLLNMKKLLTSILFLAAALTINAQDARQRTVETVVADVLAAMPANNASDFNTQIADLAAARSGISGGDRQNDEAGWRRREEQSL